MRRRFIDALLSAGALIILLVALVSVDDRVRAHVVRLATGAASGDVAAAQLHDIGRTVVMAVGDQSVAHAPLTIFVVAAAVLVLCMLRT